jgi:hypothetical protein
MSRGFRSILLGLAVATAGVFLVHVGYRPFYIFWIPGAILADSLLRLGLVPRHWYWPIPGKVVYVVDSALNWAIYSAITYAGFVLYERIRRPRTATELKGYGSDAPPPSEPSGT